MPDALIVIDVQKAFRRLEVCESAFQTAVPNIFSAIKRFRHAEKPVIFTRTSEAKDLGTSDGFELIDELEVLPTDLIIDKSFPNAFWKTSLEKELHSRDVTSVVVCGCFSMACVFLTHHGALERGFQSTVLKAGSVSSDPNSIRLLEIMEDSIMVDKL